MLTNELAVMELRMAKVHRLKKRVHAAEKDLEVLRVTCACVEKLMAECASLTEGTEQAKAERGTLASRIHELEATAATGHGDLGFAGRTVWSLKGRVAAGGDSANTAEAQARKTLDKMFELRALVEGLNQTVGGEHARVTRLADAELVHVRSVITVDLSQIEGTVSEAICNRSESFPVEASSDAPGLSDGDSSDQA